MIKQKRHREVPFVYLTITAGLDISTVQVTAVTSTSKIILSASGGTTRDPPTIVYTVIPSFVDPELVSVNLKVL